jgi:hypothetical protein
MLLCDRVILLFSIAAFAFFVLCGIRVLYFSYKYESYLYKKYPERIKELSIAAMFAYDNVKMSDTYLHLFGNINCDDITLLLFRRKVRRSYLWAFIAWFSELALVFICESVR